LSDANIFIGRQPILDVDGDIEAYELLFRDGKKGYAEIESNKSATARVLANALNQFGVKELTKDAKSFINIDETILFSEFINAIPKENFVLELLETTKVSSELVEKVKQMRNDGYTFAIDDYSGEYKKIFHRVMEYVSVVKLEIPAIALKDIKGEVDEILKVNPRIKVLAEKIEDRETFEVCLKAGCKLFQGYFFEKPTIIEGKSIDPSSMSVLQIFNALNSDLDIRIVIDLFEENPKLTFNLLKYMNSGSFDVNNDIMDIKSAINLLGRNKLKEWVALLMFSGINDAKFTEPIFETALNRSRLMKELASSLWKNNQKMIDSAGLVGILSLMDAILGVPIKKVLEEINVSNDIKEAIIEYNGNLGKLLYLIKAIEKPSESLLSKVAKKLKMPLTKLLDLKLNALTKKQGTK